MTMVDYACFLPVIYLLQAYKKQTFVGVISNLR